MVLSGTHVMEGSGKVLVTAVGVNSQAGIIFTLLGAAADDIEAEEKKQKKLEKKNKGRDPNQNKSSDNVPETGPNVEEGVGNSHPSHALPNSSGAPPSEDADAPDMDEEKSVLQAKLTNLAIQIGYGGMAVSLVTVLILSIRFSIDEFFFKESPWDMYYINFYVKFVIIGVTVLVVAVPEGLPLAVTLSLAYSVKKMMADNNLVRHLDACETMGNATAICSDKTGTLTTNRMTVVQAYLNDRIYETLPSQNDVSENLRTLINTSISVNSNYASKMEPTTSKNQLATQLGNKTECGLLGFVE